MANTKAGGLKVRESMIKKYGSLEAWKEQQRINGAKGGKLGRTGGFAHPSSDPRAAGAKGGRISRRKAATRNEA